MTTALLRIAVAAVAAVGHGVPRTPNVPPPNHRPPNIVFVLTDDLSSDLVRYMPHVLDLQRRGASFSRYFVTDSLCCPSRSSIFTGLFPHDTGVFRNVGRDGGYRAFRRHGLEARTFAVALRRRGYLTAMMGKYLNGYLPTSRHVAAGWTDWHVAGNAYPEFGYRLNENHAVRFYGRRPADYLTDVLAARASAFVHRAADAGRPFMLEVATFAPHAPYTPAPRDASAFPGLAAPRPPSFDQPNVDAPSWLARVPPLSRRDVAGIDTAYRRRAQAVQAVDSLIARVEAALASRGLANDTYVVFSSDNGYHMGEHRLRPGKMSAFDSDIRVPLIVAGPGVPRGRTIPWIAENIDLAPTFIQLARGRPGPRIDGRSLVPLLLGRPVGAWRTRALIEHHGPDHEPADPDLPGPRSGNPVTYEAMRLPNAVYVEYVDGEREYYRIDRDPSERVNLYPGLSPPRRARLHAALRRLARCRGSRGCWAAGGPAVISG